MLVHSIELYCNYIYIVNNAFTEILKNSEKFSIWQSSFFIKKKTRSIRNLQMEPFVNKENLRNNDSDFAKNLNFYLEASENFSGFILSFKIQLLYFT